MPELSRFFGIVIYVFYEDHNPPHIHAYGGSKNEPDWDVQLIISNGAILAGEIPRIAHRLLLKWMSIHRRELHNAWDAAASNQKLEKIAPLRVR